MPDQPFDPDHPDENPIVDEGTFTQLAEILGSGPDGIGDLVETFAKNAPDTLAAMQQAAEAGDMEQLAATSHKLKGEAGTFGARRLQAYCKKLELESRDGPVDGAGDRVAAIQALYEKTIEDLEARVA